jgi:hypothetical protein
MVGETRSREIEAIFVKLETLTGHSWYRIACEVRDVLPTLAEMTKQSPALLLEKIGPRVPVGVNTLRRYLSAAEFADRAIFNQREPKLRDLIFVENNFTGIETISRLDRIDPSKTRNFIEALKSGAVSTRDLKFSLSTARSRDPSSSTARRGLATARRIESRKGLQEALLSHAMGELPRGGQLYRGTHYSFVRAAWFARAGSYTIGYFFASAESRETIEAAVFAAEFGSNFFFTSWLVVPANPPEILEHALHLLKSAGSRLGLLSYGQRVIEERPPVSRDPGLLDISGSLIGEW